MIEAADVVKFWRDAGPEKWFVKDPEFDYACGRTLLEAHYAASLRQLDGWNRTAEGALALAILLDQVPRNVFRETAHSFATDSLALMFVSHAIEKGLDMDIEPQLRTFMYLPFEHSEKIEHQLRAVDLFTHLGLAEPLDYAKQHLEVIKQFGRFPHRNAALGRSSSREELAWLKAGGGF